MKKVIFLFVALSISMISFSQTEGDLISEGTVISVEVISANPIEPITRITIREDITNVLFTSLPTKAQFSMNERAVLNKITSSYPQGSSDEVKSSQATNGVANGNGTIARGSRGQTVQLVQ